MKITENILKEILTADPAARLTARKVFEQLKQGYEITGLIIRKPETGHRGIIESSAGRWLSSSEMWWLMHESESPISETLED